MSSCSLCCSIIFVKTSTVVQQMSTGKLHLNRKSRDRSIFSAEDKKSSCRFTHGFTVLTNRKLLDLKEIFV